MKSGLRFPLRCVNVRARTVSGRRQPGASLARTERPVGGKKRRDAARDLRGLDDAAGRLGRRPSRQCLRVVPIRLANAVRPAEEFSFRADSSLGRSGGRDGLPLLRLDGEDAALLGEAAARAARPAARASGKGGCLKRTRRRRRMRAREVAGGLIHREERNGRNQSKTRHSAGMGRSRPESAGMGQNCVSKTLPALSGLPAWPALLPIAATPASRNAQEVCGPPATAPRERGGSIRRAIAVPPLPVAASGARLTGSVLAGRPCRLAA